MIQIGVSRVVGSAVQIAQTSCDNSILERFFTAFQTFAKESGSSKAPSVRGVASHLFVFWVQMNLDWFSCGFGIFLHRLVLQPSLERQARSREQIPKYHEITQPLAGAAPNKVKSHQNAAGGRWRWLRVIRNETFIQDSTSKPLFDRYLQFQSRPHPK